MPFDCCECGACCFSDSDTYVAVTDEDMDRLGKDAHQIVNEIDGARYLRMERGHCAQLLHVEGEWVCGIYRTRPQACRDLLKGSVECLGERSLKRIRASRESKRLLS